MTDHNLSKLRKTFKVLGWILVIIAGAAAIVVLGQHSLGYYWLFLSPLFGIAFYMLAPRTWRVTKFFLAWFPFANELIHRQEQVDHNIAVVEKMGYTLKFYELCNIDQVDGLRNRLINSLPEVNTDSGRLENCARLAAEHLKSSQLYLPHRLLMLLYQDHHSLPPLVLWTKEKPDLIPPLAELLRTSSHLKGKVTYQKDDFEHFLRPLEIFTLNSVKKEIEGLNELWSVINAYLEFLKDHQVIAKEQPATPGKILRLLQTDDRPLNPDDLDQTLRRLLLTTAAETIGAAFSSEQKERDGFCLISLILFLEHKPALRNDFCREAAEEEEPARIVFAYLEFNEDLHTSVKLDGKDFVSLNYLVKNWASKVKEKEASLDGFQKEIQTIRQTLKQGEWITSLPYMIQRTLETIKTEIRIGFDELMADRPFILESLKRVFGNLKLETVERYLEARTINAYLITFRSPGGSVARLLNCLVSPYKQPALKTIGISPIINGVQKYNYKQYTDNGRIGVVPKGLSFEEFQQTFQEDFTKVVNNRELLCPKPPRTGKIKEENEFYWDWNDRDLKSIELILHRFGLSGRNYYGFIAEGITEAYAIARVRELFAGILNAEELYVLINYEKDEPSIIEAVMDGPITELIADQIKLHPLAIKAFKRRIGAEVDVDQQLRSEIFRSLGCSNGKDLGHHLLIADPQRRTYAIETAGKILTRNLIGTAPEFDDKRCMRIAENYLGALRAVADLDNTR